MKNSCALFLFIFFFSCYSLSTSIGQKPELVLPIGHTSVATYVSFSPDLRLIVSSSRDGTAKIWNVQTEKLLYSLEGHKQWINYADFSPDGKYVVTASSDSTGKVWDVQTGKIVHTLSGHTAGVSRAFYSPDNKFIVTTCMNDLSGIWDSRTFKLLHVLKGRSGSFADDIYTEIGRIPSSLTRDGKRLVTASRDGIARIWDVVSGRLLVKMKGHSDWVYSATFSNDDKNVITTSNDGTSKVWDARTGKLTGTFGGGEGTSTLSTDGSKIVTVNGSTELATVYDVQTDEELYDLVDHGSSIMESASSALFSPDGKYIVTSSSFEGIVKLWDAQTGKLVHAMKENVKGSGQGADLARFSPDGKWIVSMPQDGSIEIWETQSGKLIHCLKGHTSGTTSARFSQDGKLLVTVSDDRTSKIWDLETGKWLHTLKGHTDYVTSAIFSPDAKYVVTTSYDNLAIICDAATGKMIHTLKGHTNEVNSAGFSPDNKLVVTACNDGTAKIWDIETGSLLHTLSGHYHYVTSATFSPDGNLIITESDDGRAIIWDSGTGSLMHRLETKSGIYAASFSPDSKLVATLCYDNLLKIWDGKTGKELRTYKYPGPDSSDPDSEWISEAFMEKSSMFFLKSVTWDEKDGGSAETALSNDAVYAIDRKNKRLFTSFNSKLTLNDLKSGKELISWVAIDSSDWAVIHPSGLFDASSGAMEKMYYIQGKEVIALNQLKDRYYEPGLWKKVFGINAEPLRDVKGFEEIKAPPAILLSVSNDILSVRLKDNGGGIGKYRILINGKEVLTGNLPDSGNIFRGGSELSTTYNLKNHQYLLQGRDNEIEVKAYNGENFVVSNGEKIIYTGGGTQSGAKPRMFIIAIGISDYTGDLIDLKYAAKDAVDISRALMLGAKNLFGTEETFPFIKTTNDPDRANWPVKENIFKTFKEVSEQAKSSDLLVVYLSGHGINLGGQDGDFYFLTQDAYSVNSDVYADPVIRKKTTLSSAELTELIKSVSALKEVLIIDACGSGKAVENLMVRREISSSTLRALDRMKDRTGLHIITGCAADAVSYEATRYGQGVLTYSVLEGIKGAALREEKFIDVSKLFQYCTERVPQIAAGIGGIQQPQIFSPYGESSFDIGEINNSDRQSIPLSIPKPMFLMSNLIDKDSFDDVLGIEKLVDEKLRDASSKSPSSPFIFVDTRDYPDAYRIRGVYSITGDQVEIMVNVFSGSVKAGSFTIKGRGTDTLKMAEEVVTKAMQLIK
jgi:WD40 repeat protein